MTAPSPHIQIPSLAKSLAEESARQLAEIKPTNHSLPEDSKQYGHWLDGGAQKNFDEKIYMFPESYNQLRKELMNYWPALWEAVGWPMAYKAELFVERMNDATSLKLQFDTAKVESTCLAYLNALRTFRGISEIRL